MIQKLPDEILVAIFSYLSVEDLTLHIQNVCIRWRNLVQDKRLWRYLRYCPAESCSEDTIIKVLERAPNLRWPMLSTKNSLKILETICEYCKDAREIFFFPYEDKLIDKIIKGCPDIESLVVHFFKFGYNKALDIVGRFKYLKHLESNGGANNAEVTLFQQLVERAPLPESLNIQDFVYFPSTDLVYFLKEKGPQMQKLGVQCCFYFENRCILPEIATYCTNLESLTLDSHGKYCSNAPRHVFLSSKAALISYFVSNHGQKLKKLKLSDTRGFNKKLSDAIFNHCSNLQYVSFETIQLTDECLESIYLLTQLTTLRCVGCIHITDKGVAHIVRCKNLKFLSLNLCRNLTNKSFVLCCTELKTLEKLAIDTPTLELNDVLNVPNLSKNLRYLLISREGLNENDVKIYFKRVMPQLNLNIERCWIND